MTVNLLDIILLIPLLLWAYQGYKKGLIISLSSFVALFLGLYAALFFSDFTSTKLIQYFNISQDYLAIISFTVTFVVVVIVVVMLGNVIQKFVDVLMLGFLNKAAGALFGLLKGALYISILLFVINYFDSSQTLIKQKHRNNSMLYQPIESFAPFLYSWLHLDNLQLRLPSKNKVLEEVY